MRKSDIKNLINEAAVSKEGENGSYMAKQQLSKIAEYAQKLHDMIEHGEEIDDWMESNIAKVDHMIGSVYHAYSYDEEQEEMDEGKKRKIPKKYMTKNKKAMRKEIEKYAGKDTYKTKWDADYKSGKGGKGERYKTKRGAASDAYKKMYGESYLIDEDTDKTLSNKSKKTGISKTILKKVHSRGMAAWNAGHRPGTPQNAWAMGRVNSFITGVGGARKADADLWKKAKEQKAKKRKSDSKKKNESFRLTESELTDMIMYSTFKKKVSEELNYHLDREIPLSENVFRFGSESYFNLIKEAKESHNDNVITFSKEDVEFLNSDAGEFGIYEGEEVPLDIPMINEAEYKGKEVELNKPKRNTGSGKKYYVYVKDPKSGNVRKISFGDVKGGLTAKVSDPEARKRFSDRHNCPDKKDKMTAGYWSCRLNKFGHLFNGKTYPGFW